MENCSKLCLVKKVIDGLYSHEGGRGRVSQLQADYVSLC